MFNKKLKLEIVELEERILQLEKRLEDYRKEEKKAVKEVTTLVKSINENVNVTFINLQKQLKKKSDNNDNS